MQHVEEAGIHSGDSACVLPPHSLGPEMLDEIRAHTRGIALGLNTVGLINIQFAVTLDGRLFVIEANPRASRTVPFVSKAIGVPLAKMACRLMLGERIEDLGLPSEAMPTDHVCVKEAVLPFDRFTGSDALLSPEMRSTGEVMGVARDFPTAFAKAQAAAGALLPSEGTVFITLTDGDKAGAYAIASRLEDLGFRIVATAGTAQAIRGMGVRVDDVLKKVGEGSPNVVDRIEDGEIDLVINTPTGSGARADGWEIRRAAIARGIPCITTLSGAHAAARAISAGAQRRADGPVAAGAAPRPPAASDEDARAARAAGASSVDRRRRRRRLPRPARRRPDRAGAAGRGSSTCSPPPRAGARATTSGPTCRARSRFCARAAGELSFMLEDVGPGHAPPRASWRRATSCG